VNLARADELYLPMIEGEMRAVLAPAEPALARYYAMMAYHLGWMDDGLEPVVAPAGKRVRPLLCVLACAAAGGDPTRALPAAAGLELLHNFSLIHDDIEDDSATRRHRPTLWSLFGMPQACNTGDAMFSLAHLAFQRLVEHEVPVPVVLHCLRVFDEMCVALTQGQYLDMSFEARSDVSVEDYLAMIRGKTGALLATAPHIGALIAEATPADADAYRAFGAALGKAFQLQDDILGIWGDPAVTGKSAASDILSKKKTLPVAYALVHPSAGAGLQALYRGPAFSMNDIPAVLVLLEIAGARAYAEEQVQQATEEAHAALQVTGPHAERGHQAALAELLDGLMTRQS